MEVGKVISSFDQLIEHAAPVEYDNVPLAPGVTVRIRSLTGDEWTEWHALRSKEETRKSSGVVLIARSVVNENGALIGDEVKAQELRKGRVAVTEVILRAIFKLNKVFAGNEETEAKNVSSGTKSN